MKRLIFATVFCISAIFNSSSLLYAQGDRKIKINEFLVFNQSNYVDDYGTHTPWIELFNAAYNPINTSLIYISNDRNNPKKYRIPDIGKNAVIPPRSYIILYADGITTHGPFHLNFTLDSTGFIGVYDTDGRTLMDSVSYPIQSQDITYGRAEDGVGTWKYLDKSTPNSNNVTEIKEKSAEIFYRMDSFGLGLTIISMSIVFLGLILLYLIFRYLGMIYQKKVRIKVRFSGANNEEKITASREVILSGEVNAAIASALYLFAEETHDIENTTITIKKVSRPYSPWSSKIYGIINFPSKLVKK